MDEKTAGTFFSLFNEIGIINQIGTTFLEARLPDGLIAPHFSVLNHLIRVQDGQTPIRLAQAFQVPKNSMTHTLAGLERRGLVQMRPNPDDARSKQVWITPAGRDLRVRTIANMIPLFEEFEQTIALDRVTELLPRLREIREFVDELRDHRT
ncbi:MAG: MarR family transcriptional regulator [Pseudomonadota bacterium]